MKNILKKNQVIITALAIMIIVAGYLQFTKDKAEDAQQSANTEDTLEVTDGDVLDTADSEALDTASSDVLSVDDATSELLTADLENGTMDISEEDNAAYDAAAAEAEDGTKTADAAAEEATETTAGEGTNDAGEAVLVNTTINADFFASSKLKREQTRAKNKELLMSIVDSSSVTESQKQEALDKVIAMTSIAEKENAAETWLEAKGFSGAVVTINYDDGKVDVIVGVHNATEQTIAQIEDIVKNKTGVSADKITINPVEVKEAE
ncbi:SpoIIIAH-like family protein [Anaerosporobacter faecicola]|uniref:SpoIIIAH-like family protein n=1 Tax=Anaerosporobacter faecicola TaxID=2718714 RepID=UPI001439E858|nr:SpoIIIAH-like family protein [Anaerosporobacter faecicola]